MSYHNKDEVLFPRESGRFIACRCRDVRINDVKISETASVLAEEFRKRNFSLDGWKSHHLHPKVASEKAIDTIFAIDVLNFSFWPDEAGRKFAIDYDGKRRTGYWSLVAALKRAEDAGKPIYDAKYMAQIGKEDFAGVFKSSTEVEIPLLKERWRGFNQCGKILVEKFGGTFVNCVRQSEGDAVALLRLIVENFPSFQDESVFESQRVSFYKRAQILVADIWCCFEGRDLGEFFNIGEITMFADYRVPQSLEYFGILEYSENLKKLLNERVVLTPRHRIEMEIRGASIEATERLVSALKTMLTDSGEQSQLWMVNAITVDNFLWDYAREHRDKIEHLPFHLVRTIYY